MREEVSISMGLRGDTIRRAAHPLYSELSVEYSRGQGEMAFEQTLSGKLKFIDTDYDWIMAQDRGEDILVTVARDGIVFLGKFSITDCEVDYDGRKIEVELEADDAYSWIKAHWDDEYNLVGLAPKREIVEYRHRGCWQYYRQGDTKLTAIVGGDYFEMDATQTASYSDLTQKYYFNIIDAEIALKVQFPTDTQWRATHNDILAADGQIFRGVSSSYLYAAGIDTIRLKVTLGELEGDKKSGIQQVRLEYQNTAGTWLVADFGGRAVPLDGQYAIGYWAPTPAGGQSYYATLFYYGGEAGLYMTGMYCRLIHNNESVTPKYNLPTEDIAERTLNYRYVTVPAASLVKLYATDKYSSAPTEWGLAPDNTNYYTKPVFPASAGITYPLYPIGKTTWGQYSWWTGFDFQSGVFDYKWWAMAQLKDAYPLDSVLSVLLDAIFADSGIKVEFAPFADYSEFFYGGYAGEVETPPNLYITPKTNILASNYSQAAQKGDITIGQVLEMLRDVFRVMWFFERDAETGVYKLRLEHIWWFYNGGSYTTGHPFDLANARDPRTGKYWDFGMSKFTFDTAELYRRYEFGWQDKCTEWFNGDNLTCLAKYVNKDGVNKAQVKAFTTDLDMMLLSPGDFNKDGFALLGVKQENLLDMRFYNPKQTLTRGVESGKYMLALTLAEDTEVYMQILPYIPVAVACYDESQTLIRTTMPTLDGTRRRFTMPNGTAYITYTLSPGYAESQITTNVNLVTWYPRVEIPKSSEDVAPQNYRLAFHYIERSWYLLDLPCRRIAYGDGENREEYMVNSLYPVKKVMEQEIKMPWSGELDLNAGMLSTLGASVVQSFTLNLLSLFMEMKLRYGTDTK